jgi:zinc/manganese transport system substrate-binding protein
VRSLTKGASDPHFASARRSMIRRVYSADMLLAVGASLEIGWLPAALRAGRNPRLLPGRAGFLNLARSVRLLDIPTGPVNRAMGDIHVAGNPHYLLDPDRGEQVARAIAARLQSIDPDNAPGYGAGLARFAGTLAAKRDGWRDRLAPLRGRKILSYHRTFTYLADAFGFAFVGQLEPLPGIAPTASHIARLIERIKAERIGLLIMAPISNSARPPCSSGRHTGGGAAACGGLGGGRRDLFQPVRCDRRGARPGGGDLGWKRGKSCCRASPSVFCWS